MDFGLGEVSDFFKERREYQNVMIGLIQNPQVIFRLPTPVGMNNRQGTNLATVNTAFYSKPDYNEPKDKLSDLKDYRFRYNPVDMEMFTREVHYLDLLLSMAKAHNVQVVVVKMPISKENKALFSWCLCSL